MSTPSVDITNLLPSKAKTWVGLLGSLLTFGVPYLLQFSTDLPAPWPVVIGAVLAVLTALGIYHAPYAPTGTTLAPDTPAVAAAAAGQAPAAPVAPKAAPPSETGAYTNPWKQ